MSAGRELEADLRNKVKHGAAHAAPWVEWLARFGYAAQGVVYAFHQLLQWHHMLTSAGFPPTNVENLQVNTLADGVFHAATYILSLAGLLLLWQALPPSRGKGAGWCLVGAMFVGWGIFNLVEGVINHQLLGIHHVREDVPIEEWMAWDLAFLAWGALMMVGGWWLTQRNRQVMVNS